MAVSEARDNLVDLSKKASEADKVVADATEQGIIASEGRLGAWRWGPGGLYQRTERGSENLVVNAEICPVQTLVTHDHRRLLHLQIRIRHDNHNVYLDDVWVGKRSSDAASDVAQYGVPITAREVHYIQQFTADVLRLGDLPVKQAYRHLGWHADHLLIPDMGGAVFIPSAGMEWLRGYGVSRGIEADARQEWAEFLEQAATEAPVCLVAVGGALAAPALMHLPRVDIISFMLHFHTVGTSTGKTSLLELAKAAIGDPNRISTTWDGTKVGIEQMLGAVRHLPLVLDELGDARPGTPEVVAMMLSAEVGRRRGTSGGGLRPTAEWRTVALSSGNAPIAEGSAPHARRILCIPGALPNDMFAEWAAFIAQNFHGYPLHWCLPYYEQWGYDRVTDLAACYEALYGDQISSLKPQARYWAVVETGSRMLLTALGLPEDLAHRAVLTVAASSVARRRAEGIDHVSRLIDAVREAVAKEPGGFGIYPHKAQRGNLGRILEEDNKEPRLIAVLPGTTQDIAQRCRIQDLTGALMEARDREILETDKDKKRLTKVVRIGESLVRCHVFRLPDDDSEVVPTSGDEVVTDFEAGVTTCYHQSVFVTTVTTKNNTLSMRSMSSKVVTGGNSGNKDNLASRIKLNPVTTSVTTKKGEVVTKRKEKPSNPCYACGSTDWWQRADGGWVCGVCHPRPGAQT